MITLDLTTRSLEVVLADSVTTTELPIVASFLDVGDVDGIEQFSPLTSLARTAGTSAVTAVAAPRPDIQRQLKFLSVRNADTAAATVAVQINDDGTPRVLLEVTLAVDDTLLYTDGEGFRVVTGTGGIKTLLGE